MTEFSQSGSESIEKLRNYIYGLIDPRPTPEAKAANEKLFENINGVLGIEVTIPEYADRCGLGNIDPQHSEGNADIAAIEIAQTCEIPSNNASLITVRADLDSVGAMALIKFRANGGVITPEMITRIRNIATSDKFARGGWPGKIDLPTKEKPWPSPISTSEDGSLACIAAQIADFKVPIADRVKSMEEYLVYGTESAGYRERVEAERAEMISALENDEIKINLVADGRIAYVESSHRAATSLGYSQAPIVVAFNPKFKQGSAEEYKKYTVCQFDNNWIDLGKVKDNISKMESGWGGSPTIIGSPQGKSSELSKDVVLKEVEDVLKTRNTR